MSENTVTTKTSKAAKKTSSAAPAKPYSASQMPKAATSAAALDAAPATAVSGAAPDVKPTDRPQPVIAGPMMRKKELIDTVVERSGQKKKDVKPVVEMMLEVLGEALGDNRELNLHPFGKLKVRRERELPNGRVVVAKIRQSKPPEKVDPMIPRGLVE